MEHNLKRYINEKNYGGVLKQIQELKKVHSKHLVKAIENDDFSIFNELLKHAEADVIIEVLHHEPSWILIFRSSCCKRIVEAFVESLMPVVTFNEETIIMKLLRTAIDMDCCLSIIDQLWCKSYSTDVTTQQMHIEKLSIFYKPYVKVVEADNKRENGLNDRNWKIVVKVATEVGISRHLKLLSTLPENEQQKDLLISPPDLNQTLLNDSDFYTSEIQGKSVQQCQLDKGVALRKVFQALDTIQGKEEVQHVHDAVRNFMNTFSEQIAQVDPELTSILRLVGSANENTRSLWPDEFDYLIEFDNICKQLHIAPDMEQNHKVKMDVKKDSAKQEYLNQFIDGDTSQFCVEKYVDYLLSVMKATLSTHGESMCKDGDLKYNAVTSFKPKKNKYPILSLRWKGSVFKDMEINIDIVPVFRMEKTGQGCIHNYAPSNLEYHWTLWSTLYVDCKWIKWGFLFTDSFSIIENRIIKSLPTNIIQGYRLAKALRMRGIFAPIADELFKYAVCDDLQDLVKSYLLKTAVFYLTQNLTESSTEMQHDRIHWAILIYRKLKAFVHDGLIPHFFGAKPDLFKCEHALEDMKQLNFQCCRKRMAMLTFIECALETLNTEQFS